MERITYYHILGVSSDATEDEIAAAFRSKVKQWHPDVSCHPDAEERMREINEAAEVLCDPGRRARYDQALLGDPRRSERPAPDRPAAEGTGITPGPRAFRRDRSAAFFTSRSSREAMRFAAAGGAALLILGILVSALIAGLPLMFGPAGSIRQAAAPDAGLTPAATAGTVWFQGEGDVWFPAGEYPEAADPFGHVLRVASEEPSTLARNSAALIGLGHSGETSGFMDQALADGSDTVWILNNRILERPRGQKGAPEASEDGGMAAGLSAGALYRETVLGSVSPTGI